MQSDQSLRLAIDGGEPVLPAGPPAWPQPDDEIREALAAAYADGSWGRYSGPHSERLCELLAGMHDVRHVWLCSSGTIAVELALRGLKIGPGDEVILAAYDFPGNFRAIEAVEARPVLVDLSSPTLRVGHAVSDDVKSLLDDAKGPTSAAPLAHTECGPTYGPSWTLDPAALPAAISPQTKAIIVSHLHGTLAEMRRICEFAQQHGLAVVEDACQVPGAIVQGKPAGSWGDCGILSFGGSKLLTAGRGGAILTSRDDVVQRIRIHSQRGNEAFPLSELQAAVLVPQVPKLAAANQRRLAAVGQLLTTVGGMAGLLPLSLAADDQNQPVFYKLPWLIVGNDACDSPQFDALRKRFIAATQAEGVMLDEGFRGFARRTSNRCRVVGDLANARRAAAGTVLLHHPVLLEPPETIAKVAEAIRKVGQVFDLPSTA
ncbi:MAG: aminotransferase class V-fold PLP-dependent enzyme [Planctomycetaceae bacterium]|nr:aminotransferase class V-fold PLP-dependent enzyme [Planctomycetaceae bacterium]